MPAEHKRQGIGSIQMLRGIAAALVVLFHASIQLQRVGFDAHDFKWMQAGVDIFFVISGFIMWVTTENAPNRTARDFLFNRLRRIVPLYWLITLGMTALLLVAPRLLQSAVFDPVHIIKSLFFIAAYNDGTHLYQPLLVPGWTLNVEMYFYLLFTIAIAVSAGSRSIRAAVLSALLLGSAALPLAVDNLPGEVLFYCQPIIVEFLFGIFLGWLFLARPINLGISGWMVAAAGLVLMAQGTYDEGPLPLFIEKGIPALMIVGGALFATPFKARPLEGLGNISYSLYLTHALVLSAFAQVWKRAGLFESAPPAVFFVVSGVFCIAVAIVAYVTVERPAQGLGKRGTVWRKKAAERKAALAKAANS